MRRLLLPIAALLLSDALLLVGHGLQLTLLPLRAEFENFTPTEIGLTGSAYFLGFVVNCFLAPHIIKRAGHIRAFAVMATLFSAMLLMFEMFPDFVVWLFLRFIIGGCLSGLYMVIESWLNERSTRETRGTILSTYTVINLSMIMLGQQLLNFSEPSGTILFSLAAVLVSLAIIPVSLTLSLQPAPMTNVNLNLKKVWALSHVGVSGAITCGLVTGAFWSLGPVYAKGIGMEINELTMFMSAAVLGGALSQLPLGRLSDHYDRRLVIFFAVIVGTLVSFLISLVSEGGSWMTFLMLLWGAASMPLYAISLAHATDNAMQEDFVMVGSGLLLIFGVGSAIGGPLASLFMSITGPRGLFLFATLSLGLFALYIAIRRNAHVLPVIDETEPFRAMAETSPVAFEMDPRQEEGHREDLEADPEVDIEEDPEAIELQREKNGSSGN